MDDSSRPDERIALGSRISDVQPCRSSHLRHTEREDPPREEIKDLLFQPNLHPGGLNLVTPTQPSDPYLNLQNRHGGEVQL